MGTLAAMTSFIRGAQRHSNTDDNVNDYNHEIDRIRKHEYPSLDGMTYLDHAGTTLYARSLIDGFAKEMSSDIFGNPHSASASSQLSTRRIENIRTRALRFFNADPDFFDLVFVPNATAGIKIVMEALREFEGGFWYGYHKDSHTSLVGVRETAKAGHRCFLSDEEVERWLEQQAASDCQDGAEAAPRLFAYPAQSNMNGRRLPMNWSSRLQTSSSQQNVWSLLDAAALVSTYPLDLGDPSQAPDFTVLSFYKIFGFPDLGALIVRKDRGGVLRKRAYFGGGTVDMVTCGKENWHISKHSSLHEQLEDGTLPIHGILALNTAFDVHAKLFGSMDHIAKHTSYLVQQLDARLRDLRHFNGVQTCEMYSNAPSYSASPGQGPVIAFNIKNSRGHFISNTEVEKLANVRNVHLRSGGLCNPGGIADSLSLAPWEMRRNFSAGQRCGNEHDIMDGRPTGMLRISLGAMNNMDDADTFVSFVEEFFVERTRPSIPTLDRHFDSSSLFIESLTVFPIKSCGGWTVPENLPWRVRREGLAWDREWCLIHQGTRQVLSQKKHPKMALIKPSIDLNEGLLRVRYFGSMPAHLPSEVNVPLSADPSYFQDLSDEFPSMVCGDVVSAHTYASTSISDFFSTLLGTPCTLARSPSAVSTTRHSKPHLLGQKRPSNRASDQPSINTLPSPLLMSNESPILVISRSSVNRLNEQIKQTNPSGKAAHASVFRANIVLAEENPTFGVERPYAEDHWSGLCIERHSNAAEGESAREKADDEGKDQINLDILGGCRRCQMVCIDQMLAVKDEEPFVTLAKTRRRLGKGVFFGVHTALSASSSTVLGSNVSDADGDNMVQVGDRVWPIVTEEEGEVEEV